MYEVTKREKTGALYFRGAGVSVSGQIDQVPAVVDTEVVDQLGFAGYLGGLGDPAAAQGVDQRGFADVAAADEGVFRGVEDRDALGVGTRGNERGLRDVHFSRPSCRPSHSIRMRLKMMGCSIMGA